MIPTAFLKEQDFVLSSLAPSAGQKRLALAVVLVLTLAYFAVEGPLATVRLPRLTAFLPVYVTAVFVNDSITAVVLFAQFSILRSRALLAIASGYLFTALIMIPGLLTLPGVLAPTGLLGAGLQSAAWLYIIWHIGFPLFVIAYVLLKEGDPIRPPWTGSLRVAVLSSVGATAGLVAAATYLVTASDLHLPGLMRDVGRNSPLWAYAAAIPTLLSIAAAAVLWARRRSVLDLWLTVVMVAYVIEISLVSFPVRERYSVQWYSGRVFGMLSGSLILFVLLYEITTLYARLLRAMAAQRREREARLMTGDAVSASIAHEIRQPLAAMTISADAGRRWLKREVPDLAEARAAFEFISMNGHRASAVIEGIRAMYRKDPSARTSVDLAELVGEALGLLRGDLSAHRISVRTELSDPLPPVNVDRVQLQQVLVNLISNAIEAMARAEGRRELCIRLDVDASGGVLISVADTGPGIAPKDMDQIFSPLFSTKAHGMGMGLSICRSIVEAHDGRLSVMANRPRGAVFQILIPSSDQEQAAAERHRAFGG